MKWLSVCAYESLCLIVCATTITHQNEMEKLEVQDEMEKLEV
jgi:hypothetical protein